MGHFVEETITCKECLEDYVKDTEKQGDINVALQLLRDAYEGHIQNFYLVTADSDQAATARIFRELFPDKKLISVAPPGRSHSKHILAHASSNRSIFKETIERCLFLKDVTVRGRWVVTRPQRYDPPSDWKRPTAKVR